MNRSTVVAIVDDDPAPRRGLVRLLNAAGYETRDFASPDELLRDPADGGITIRCLVLDARLPGTPLLEFRGELAKRGIEVPCIVVTADDSNQTRQMAREMNAVAFFCKPVDGMALLDAVRWAIPDPLVRPLAGVAAVAGLSDTMKQAVALVKSYLPPEPALIQKAKDSGRVSLTPLPGQRVRLTFTDYLKTGDTLALDLDLANNRPLTAKVSSYLDSQKDAVTLDVTFGTLDSGETYTSIVQLEAKATRMTVNVQNSGYRKSGN